MLVLSRKVDEVVRVGNEIKVTVIEVRGDKVRLGFDVPKHIAIHREEIWLKVQGESADVAVSRP